MVLPKRVEDIMKVGDLVKSVIDDPSVHTQRHFVVAESRINWIKLFGVGDRWHPMSDWRVISESR